MNTLNIQRSGAIFVVMFFCASQKVSSDQGKQPRQQFASESENITQSKRYTFLNTPFSVTYESTDSSKLTQTKNGKSIANTDIEELLLKTKRPMPLTKFTSNRENDEKMQKVESNKSFGGGGEISNISKRNSGSSFKFFSPFLPFSFLPFPLTSLKKDMFHVNYNLSDEKDKGSKFSRKPEPLLLIDFAFDIREIPASNKTSEPSLPKKDNVAKVAMKKSFSKVSRDSSSPQKVAISDISENEWSFFDDSPLLPPDMDEFLPKSDFLLFDFPFHKNPVRRIQRHKKDVYKPAVKSDLNFLIDVFDEALSRTKKEMEKSVPLWNLMSNGPKDYNLEKSERGGFLNRLHQVNRIKVHEQDKPLEKQLNERRSMRMAKRNSSKQHKSPFIMGKVVKVGEIHIDDDLPKNKNRRSSPVLGSKLNRGVQETSIELIRMKPDITPKFEELVPRLTNSNDITFKIHSEVITNEENTQKKEKSSLDKNDEQADVVKKFLPLSGEMISEIVEESNKSNLQEQEPSQEVAEKVTASEPKEGFRFVSHVPNSNSSEDANSVRMGDQISIGDRRSNDSRGGPTLTVENSNSNSRNDHVAQPNLKEGGRHTLDRERRHMEGKEGDSSETQQVADLNNLFLTVTLPTMFAFTILLLICFFNLQVRGWLCMRLFRTREVSVVEEDAECNRILKGRIYHET